MLINRLRGALACAKLGRERARSQAPQIGVFPWNCALSVSDRSGVCLPNSLRHQNSDVLFRSLNLSCGVPSDPHPAGAFPWLIPLVVVTRSVDLPIIGERLVLFDFITVVWLGSLMLWCLRKQERLGLPRDAILVLSTYGLFLAICVLSLIDAEDLSGGIIVLAVYSFAPCIAFASLSATRIGSTPRPLLVSLIISFNLVILLGAIEAAGLPSIVAQRHPTRLTSTFRNPNQLGSFLFILFPIAGGFLLSPNWRNRRLKQITALALVVCPFVVALTSSRSSVVVVIVEIVLFLFLAPFWAGQVGRMWTRLVSILGTSCLVISAGFYLLSEGRHSRLFQRKVYGFAQYLAESPDLASFQERLSGQASGIPFIYNTFRLPLETISTEPWLGIGIGNALTTYQMVPGRFNEVHNQYGHHRREWPSRLIGAPSISFVDAHEGVQIL